MAHYALVGIIAPTLVAGGIFCLAQRHTAACERNLYQGKITVSWVWPTSSGRLLMAGQIEMYGSHWLWQRNKLGAIWAIERDGGKLHYLTSGRAVRTPLTWRNLGFMERLPRLDRMVVPQEPTELELLLGGGETLVSVDFSGRFEPVPVPPGEDPLDNVRRTAVQLGLEMNEQDAALIAKAMGGDRGPWTLHPYPRHAAVLIEGPYNPKDRKVVLFDLKNDRAVPIEEPLDSYDLLVDGPRGREIVFLQSEHESSRAVAFNPQKKTRTVLTGYQRNLKLSGATDEIVLVRLGGQSFYDRRYGVARLDPGAEFKELAWPEEEMRFSTITPRGRIHAWTDKSLHIIDPASGEERTLARPKEMEPNTLGLKGYIEDDPIVELKNELKRLDTQSGKLKTLVRISSYPQL
jgi:hypothetical protein